MLYYRRELHHKYPHSKRIIKTLPATDGAMDNHEITDKMSALHLIYHEDLEAKITGIIHTKMLIARYTKIRDVIGARSDMLEKTDYLAQGQNNMLIIVAGHEEILALAEDFRDLRQKTGHGLRGYILPVEGLI